MSNHMNNKTNQILLIDSSITLTKINDLKSHTKKIITFPCDQHLTRKEMKYVIKCVNNFYKGKKN